MECLQQSPPSHAPLLRQPIIARTFILSLFQPKNLSQQDAAAHQSPPGSSSLSSSPLQYQANCLQAIHKAIQQINQQMRAEHLERKILQLITLQLQNDFALLRTLLFPSVGTIPICDTSLKNPATSPPIHTKPSPNPNPHPTSNALVLPCAAEPSVRRSTPVGAVGPPRAKTKKSANTNFQPTSNNQEAPPITGQNLTSRVSRLEKLFTDEIATDTSTTAGIPSQ